MGNRILLAVLGVFLFSLCCSAKPPFSPKDLFVYDSNSKQSRDQLGAILEITRYVYIVGDEEGVSMNVSKEDALSCGVSAPVYDYIAGVVRILNNYYDTLTNETAKQLFVVAFRNGGCVSFKQFVAPVAFEQGSDVAVLLPEDQMYEIGFTTAEYEALDREIQNLNDNVEWRDTFRNTKNQPRVRICVLVPIDLFVCYPDPVLKMGEMMEEIDKL